MKSKLVFVLFIFLTFLMARDIAYVQNNTPLLKAEAEQIVNPIMSSSDRSISSRTDTTTIWFDDLEGDVSGWTNDAEWVLTEVTSNSPTHSFNADDDNYDTDPMLVSPIITLPELIYDTQFIKFSFAVWCNTPDSDGDDDGFLEDYYFVELANVSQTQGIYPDATLERLETPSITLAGTSPVLSFKLNYSIEAYAGDPQTIDGCEINGWDAANVRISTDNGVNWSVLSGTPAYDYSSCYGWSSNADGCNVPGWGGTATAGWADASFDLNAYVGQTVKLGFYFGSDPNTAETGFFLDNVLVTNAASDTIFFDNADDQVNLVPVALNGTTTYFHTDTYEAYENNSWWFGAQDFVWDQIFYDYGDIGRPGGSDIGWQVYMPGDPFNGNTQMDLSAYAGYDVKLRFRARFDDNDDGGNAGGLYIDDIHFWQIDFQEGPPAITGLNAVAGDAVVNVTWNDLNTGGGFNGDVIYDDGSFENAIGLTDPGEAYLGTMFDAPFGVTSITVNTVDIFGYAGATGATNIYGFSVAGGIPDETPLYTQSITTVDDQWVTQSVTGWTFTGDFVIALGTTDLISTAIDENTVPSGHSWSNLGAGWSDWATVAAANGLSDGEWGIRANVTSVGGMLATYNVYRNIADGEYFLMFNGQNLTEPAYTDNLVANGVNYCYKVAAVFDIEGDQAGPVCGMPEAQTVHEIAYDDGEANTSTNATDGNFLAVKFTPEAYPSDLVRLKYYIPGTTGGVALTQVWDDDGVNSGPGTILGIPAVIQLVNGWSEKNVVTQEITINDGSFYVGWQETVQTPAIGIDTDSPADNSLINVTGSWEPFANYFSGAIMIRVDMDTARVAVGDELAPDVPVVFALAQNYPNPFNPLTNIEFNIPSAGLVTLTLYDITGQEVETMISRNLGAGHYQYQLNAGDLASGLYLYQLKVTGDARNLYTATRKLMLIK